MEYGDQGNPVGGPRENLFPFGAHNGGTDETSLEFKIFLVVVW